jgi:hypothetical protein
VSGSVYMFGTDRACRLILSWGRASDQIENVSPLFRGLSFLLLGCIAPSICVTMLGIPDSEIDQKIMTRVERLKMATLYVY